MAYIPPIPAVPANSGRRKPPTRKLPPDVWIPTGGLFPPPRYYRLSLARVGQEPASNPVRATDPTTTITLDALAADPSRIQSLPTHIQADLYRQVARLEAELRSYLLTADRQTKEQADQVLTIREAAGLLRVSLDSLHRKWRALPFAFKDPLDGRVKFRRRGVEHYVENLRGGPPQKGRV